MKLLAKFNLVLIGVFAAGLVPAALLSRGLLERNALQQVEENARIMMQTAMAVRGYTIQEVAPLLVALCARARGEGASGRARLRGRRRSQPRRRGRADAPEQPAERLRELAPAVA